MVIGLNESTDNSFALPYTSIADLANVGNTPHLDQLSLLAQACAILRKPEYNPLLIHWLSNVLDDHRFNLFSVRKSDEAWNISNEHSFVSCLQAITFLMGQDTAQIEMFKELCLEKLVKACQNIEIELSEEHATLIPSLLWSIMCLQDKDQTQLHFGLIKRGLEVI